MRFPRSGVARVAGLALLVALSGVAVGQGEAPRAKPRALTRLDQSIISEFGGTKAATRPSRDATMGFSLPTQVSEVLLRGGAEVKKGDMIVRGDEAEDVAILKLQKVKAEKDWPVQKAEKAAALAKVEYEKTKTAFDQRGSSAFEVDRARLSSEAAVLDHETAKVNQTQEVLQVERLEARLEKMRLRAPFDGEIDSVMVDVGQSVTENEKVVRVVNVDPLWMDVPAPTEDPATLSLKPGDKAWVLIDIATGSRVAEGKVIEVSPTTDLASRSRRIRVELPNPKGPQRILAGEPAWVRFTQPSAEVMSKVTAAIEAMKQPVQASK
ncbi:MAG TPA: efflux RND transporter periplasmic adaptor subunit [Phycisphaerales bacterium]|nr:efflux RND transporter periplasmic adaptor subunit [Phycisphaerales bacterium]